ncbi:MAG: hypothetical protein A2W35_15450 [Chloroflexi bacterium RBG_16_57_11]|nr:MAG: hypothetical protein A2W35_15450 [Chloroflexi bacterium RBG_16_57_11]
MTPRTDTARFTETIKHLSRLRQYRLTQPPISHTETDAALLRLRAWQSTRLAQTHADLLESHRYGPACRFFLDEIYAQRDFSQRDQDIEYLYAVMSSFLPEFLIKVVRKAIEMNDLTNELDWALSRTLAEKLGVTNEITPQIYAEAYRVCNNYAERAHQIHLIGEVGRLVDRGTRIPLVGVTLHLARRPARRAGWGELQIFLEKGYTAFKHMGRADEFLNTIQEREMAVLERIFDNHPDPFLIE